MTNIDGMSDIDLLEAVAEEVLGWTISPRSDTYCRAPSAQKRSRPHYRLYLDWLGIGKVVESLTTEPKKHEVELSESPYFGDDGKFEDAPLRGARYACTVWQVNTPDNYVRARSNESMARAVFEAALAAVRVG